LLDAGLQLISNVIDFNQHSLDIPSLRHGLLVRICTMERFVADFPKKKPVGPQNANDRGLPPLTGLTLGFDGLGLSRLNRTLYYLHT
jgi:hypothetical protein